MVFLSPLIRNGFATRILYFFHPVRACAHALLYVALCCMCIFSYLLFFSPFFSPSCNVMVWLNPVFRLNKSPHSTTHTIDYDLYETWNMNSDMIALSLCYVYIYLVKMFSVAFFHFYFQLPLADP